MGHDRGDSRYQIKTGIAAIKLRRGISFDARLADAEDRGRNTEAALHRVHARTHTRTRMRQKPSVGVALVYDDYEDDSDDGADDTYYEDSCSRVNQVTSL